MWSLMLATLRRGLTTVCVERRLPWRIEQWAQAHTPLRRWQNARWRARERRLFRRVIQPGDLVFDIGANVGDKTDAFRHCGARVIALEPDPRNLDILRPRFAHDVAVQILPVGAGATCESVPFYRATDHARSTCARDAMVALDGCRFTDSIPIALLTLDALIARYGSPDFVKIDVEGFEPSVLSGLSQPVPLLSFEFHSELRAALDACLDRLAAIGMTRFNLLLYPVGNVASYHPLDRLYFDAPVSRATMRSVLDRYADRPLAGDVYAFT